MYKTKGVFSKPIRLKDRNSERFTGQPQKLAHAIY